MSERVRTLTIKTEDSMRRIEVPFRPPQGWQGATPRQVRNSADAVRGQTGRKDSKMEAARWVDERLDGAIGRLERGRG